MVKYVLIAILGIFILLLVSVIPMQFSKTIPSALTLEDLPPDAKYARHPEEESEAQGAEKIVMRHYATPSALKAGGPIYGLMGFKVVAIEYEIPAAQIPTKTVGQEFPGYLLRLPEFQNIPYDHFHISFQEHGLASYPGQGVYSIHFPLISHEEELKFGLVCE